MGIYKVKGNDKEAWYLDIYHDGRRIRKAVGSKKDAENALAAVKADILRGEYRFKRDRRVRFEDFAKEYLEYLKVNKKSWERNKSSLKSLVPHFKGILLSKITPKRIEEFKRKRLEQVQPSTINRDLGCLNHMFNIAKKLGYFENDNPVKEVKFFQERQREMRILSKDEINQLINTSKGYMRAIIILALNTAMRRGEIFNLKWSDIDFVDNYIFIKNTKSGVARKVPMNSLVVTILKSINRESEFVFYKPTTKEPLKDVTKSFKTACRNIGIPDLRFHDLRHSSATHMVTSGVDLVTVKEILGHSNIAMTMKYAHPTPENRKKAVDVLASIIEQREKFMVINKPQDKDDQLLSSLISKN